LAVTARLKVLISAYACSPYKGSEPGVGWGFVVALAQRHDLWVIVEEEKFRADIERYLAENPQFAETVRFVYLKKQRNRLLRKIWPPSYYWYYRRWHEGALGLAQALHQEVGFDLAHQLTMVGFREPGYLWKLGIPFVWGPVGGMGLFPWRFLPSVGAYGALYYLGYNLFNTWQMCVSQRPKLAAKSAGLGLITATPENQLGAEKYWGCSSELISEVGLPPAPSLLPTGRKPGKALRLVWTGLHIPRKALNLALAALVALPKDHNWELHVLGKGPRTLRWQQLAHHLGLADRCHFHGWLRRDEAMQIMAPSHLMLITSLRDLTSTVTIEALALGLPIVCLDHCGFAGVVDDTCGIKVPVKTPASVVAGLAAAISRLAGDEPLRFELAKGAVQRAQDFTWDKKAAAVDHIYRKKMSSQQLIEK
jgi:glycosyltransferase involved in cell wall biosynthesis